MMSASGIDSMHAFECNTATLHAGRRDGQNTEEVASPNPRGLISVPMVPWYNKAYTSVQTYRIIFIRLYRRIEMRYIIIIFVFVLLIVFCCLVWHIL